MNKITILEIPGFEKYFRASGLGAIFRTSPEISGLLVALTLKCSSSSRSFYTVNAYHFRAT